MNKIKLNYSFNASDVLGHGDEIFIKIKNEVFVIDDELIDYDLEKYKKIARSRPLILAEKEGNIGKIPNLPHLGITYGPNNKQIIKAALDAAYKEIEKLNGEVKKMIKSTNVDEIEKYILEVLVPLEDTYRIIKLLKGAKRNLSKWDFNNLYSNIKDRVDNITPFHPNSGLNDLKLILKEKKYIDTAKDKDLSL